MPEHHDPAEPQQAAAHGCTCGAHPITRACPVSCPAAALSASAFNPLDRACERRARPGAATVGHVVDLHRQRRLDGLGPRRLGEVEVSLVLAGLINADRRPPARPPPADSPTADNAAPDTDDFPDLMKLAEVAAAFRVHSRTIIRWADTGRLPSSRTAGGHRRFRAAHVRALLATARPAGQGRRADTGTSGSGRNSRGPGVPARANTADPCRPDRSGGQTSTP